MRTFLISAVAAFIAGSAAHAEMVMKTSPHDVPTTMDRLAAAVENAGAKVFARIDHAAGAASIGAELAATEVLIFGNPRIGTPVMAANPAAGLDLPLRVVVFADAEGATQIGYRAPNRLAEDHGVSADLAAFKTMSGALNKLTDAAIAE